ncbi:MAG TPA: DUF1476 domain-containing protein [Alphaproteobacteria bacterium]|jgi:hypothetical protein
MSGFEDREKGFEAKFHLDQEAEFKVKARRDKLFGLWAAAKLGLPADAAETYATGLVITDVEKHSDTLLLEKVGKDLAAKGIAVTDADLVGALDKSAATAREQVLTQGR